MEQILKNLEFIQNRIISACEKANRNPKEVQLLLATKTVPASRIQIAIEAGFSLIGENKVQELKEKYEDLKIFNHQTHFIGHLQTNKIKDVIRYADCIQSVDRLDLATKLNQRLQKENRVMDIFVQVNTSYEESKFGVLPENTIQFIKDIAQLENLKIKGLMTIGLLSTDPENSRKCFRLLKKIQSKIRELELLDRSVNELSMGMSGDLEVAIEEGATMIRVGTAVFGMRQYPDSYYWDEAQS